MIVIGLLLIIAAVGLSLAVVLANPDTLESSAGTFTLLGYSIEATSGQLLIVGAGVALVTVLGLMMVMGGLGRRSRRRNVERTKLRRQREELLELQRKQEEAEAKAAPAPEKNEEPVRT